MYNILLLIHLVAVTECYDVVIVGGTPAGVMAAIATARCGHSAIILERSKHLGGLCSNGLGRTDIHTRGATTGLFLEFTQRIRQHYAKTYGTDSVQLRDCLGGYAFEPSVGERIFNEMLHECAANITIRKAHQFDTLPENITVRNQLLHTISVFDLEKHELRQYEGKMFVDASYEGDLAAAAGVFCHIGRESKKQYDEAIAGKIYMRRGTHSPAKGSTGEADNAIQAYNYRLCLTQNPHNQSPIIKPKNYSRIEYISLIDDLKQNRTTGPHTVEPYFDGIGRIVNAPSIPNGKVDANNQHLAFLSTNLAEENWPWPSATWTWRDCYANRLRDYTLGLLWFAQNDVGLPEEFRKRCRSWGLAKDEYADNGHFPRQVYVREARRIHGEYVFTAHDALPIKAGTRPPIHSTSITASHYALDSHNVRKREPNRVNLEGFVGCHRTKPYTVPYGVILPKEIDNLLVPVAVSATHIGFSTLRMEPCWMALGQAAGTAASLSIETNVIPRKLPISALQQKLLKQDATLIYFQDSTPDDPYHTPLQYFALRGLFGDSKWKAELSTIISDDTAKHWIQMSGCQEPSQYIPGKTTRGEFLNQLFIDLNK